jgi:uncharacterized membrane protein
VCALLAASVPCAFGASPPASDAAPNAAPAAAAPAATTQPSGQYVTREQYDELARRLDAVTKKLDQLDKKSATKTETDEYLKSLHQEMLDVKKLAQQQEDGSTHLTIVGDAAITYTDQKGSNSTFGVGFAPLFLWQLD